MEEVMGPDWHRAAGPGVRVAELGPLGEDPPVSPSGHRGKAYACETYASTARTRRWSSTVGGRPSLLKMLVTCFSTARSVTTSASAIAWLDLPSAISPSTSRSRGLSASSG